MRDSVSLIKLTGTKSYDLPASPGVDVNIQIDIPEGYDKIAVIEVSSGSSRGAITNFATTVDGVRIHVVSVTGSAHSGRTAKATIICSKLLQ